MDPPPGFKFGWQMPATTKKSGRRRPKVTDRRHDWSEQKVFSKLQYVFPPPAFIVLPGVRNETGHTAKSRTIDGLVASIYPSRGLWLGAVEIKITKSDWRKEIRDAEKSDAIQKYCKYFYVASPSGVIPEGEVPETWGQIEVREDGATIVRRAPELSPEPITLPMTLSILRRVSECTVPLGDVDELIEKRIAELLPKDEEDDGSQDG